MPGDLEYKAAYNTALGLVGGGTLTHCSIADVITGIATAVAATGGGPGGTKAAQVGNGTAAGAHLWSGSGVPSAQTFTSTTGDIYFRTDGAAGTAIYIATAGGTPGTWAAVT